METFNWDKLIWKLQSFQQAGEKLGSQWASFKEGGDYQNQIC